MEHPDSWDKNLPWAEFSYNNSYQQSLKMARFEVIYGCRCHTLLNWIEPGEKVVFGPDIVDEAKAMVHHIQDNLRAAKSRQESYANKRHQPFVFEAGNHVYLMFLPMKGVKRFGMKGSWHLVTLNHSLYLRSVEPWHTSLNCYRRCQEFTTSSMYHN
jgi:hypothetical protein